MRFYDGTPVSTRGKERADKLLRRYMANINKVRRKAEDYGGGTGGRKRIDNYRAQAGLNTIRQRQSRQRDLRRIFKDEGIGRYGARRESFNARFGVETEQDDAS